MSEPTEEFRTRFREWCRVDKHATNSISVSQLKQEFASDSDGCSTFDEYLPRKAAGKARNKRSIIKLNFDDSDRAQLQLDADDYKEFATHDLKIEILQGPREIILTGFRILNLHLAPYVGVTLCIHRCEIAALVISNHSNSAIELTDTWVGRATFSQGSCRSFSIERGGIWGLSTPPPSDENPFLGDVLIDSDVFLPRVAGRYFIDDPQEYRNLRHHLTSLNNVPAAQIVHAAELAMERQRSSKFTRFLSTGYEWITDYGTSPERALKAFCLGWFANFCVLVISRGGFLRWLTQLSVSPAENWLPSAYLFERAARQVGAALQLTVNPTAALGPSGISADLMSYGSILLTPIAVYSATVIALFIFAVRGKFRLR